MKKTISFVLSVLVLIASICAITAIVYADDGDITFYDVYVGGVRVNSENMDDILGDGTVAYTPASGDEDAKLTIANTTISSAYAVETKDGFAVANIVADESLQVEFIGNNNLSASTYSSIANNAEIYDDTLINLNAIYICDSAEEKRNLTISGDYAFIKSNVAESVAISVPDNIYFDAKKVETSGRVVSRNNGNITLQSGAFEIINRKDDTKNAFGSSNIVIDSSLDANEIDSYYATSYSGEYIQSTISNINSYTADNEGAGICKLYIGVHIYFYLEGEAVTYKNLADPRYDESVTYDKETKTITLHDNVQIQNNTFLTSGKFEKDQKIRLLSGIVITEAAEGKAFTNIPNIEATGDATFKCTQVASNGLNYTSEGNLTIESYGSTQWGSVIGGSQAVIRANNIDIKSNRQVNVIGTGSTDIYATGSVSIENKTETTFSLVSSGTFNVEADSLTLNGYTNEYGVVSCGSSVLSIKKDITVTNEGSGNSFSSGNTEITAENIAMTGNGNVVLSGGNAATITATGDITIINAGKDSAISSGNTKISCVNLKAENNGDDNTISGGSALIIEATGDVSVVNKGESEYYGAISSGGTTITAKSLTAEANSTSGAVISGGSKLKIEATGDVTVLNSVAGSAISSGDTTINCANLKAENNGDDNNTISGGSALTIEATGDVTVNNKGKGYYTSAISSGGTTITAKSLTAQANSTGGAAISGGGFFNLNCTGDVTVLNSAAGSAISSGNTTINCANLKTENNGDNNTISGGMSLSINCTGDVIVSNLASNSAISSAETTVKGANITVTSNGSSYTISGGSKVTMVATGDITVLNTAQENGGTAISGGEASLSGKSLTVSSKSDSATMSTGMKTTLDFTGDITVTNKQNGTTISTGALDIKNAKNVTIEANCQGSAIPTGSISINATGDVTLRNNMKEGSAVVTSCGNFNVKADSLKVEGYSNDSTIISNGTTKIETNKNVSMRNNGSYLVVSTGKLDIVSGGNVDITAAESSGTVIAGGSGIKIDAKGSVTVKAESGKKSNGMLISADGVDIKAASFNAVGYTNGESMLACGNGLTIDVTGDANITNNGNGLAIAGNAFNVKNAKNVTVTSNSNNYTVGTGSVDVNAENSAVILNKSEKGGAVSSSSMNATANNVVIKGNTSGTLISCGSANIKADEITVENANKDGVVNSCPITVSLKSGGDIYTSSGDKLSNAGASTTIPAGSTGKISAGTHTTHAYVVSKQVAATCTKAGYVEKTCSACGEKETTTIAALGHVDKNKDGYCDRCKVVTDKTLINPCRNAQINVAAAKTVDYKSKATIKATAKGVPNGYYLAVYVNGKQVAKGTNTEVTYEAGQVTSDISYTVKVVDAKGNIQKDASGKDLAKDGGKITCNAGFFKKIIAFFRGLFGLLPVVVVKP